MTSIGPWIAIQRNPKSGAGGQQPLLDDLLRGLRQSGFEARVFTDRQQMQDAVDEAQQRSRLYGIVAAGGDGTLLDVSTRYPGIPVAILPLGTENLVARYLRIPKSGTAVAQIIAAGHRCRMDAARLGDRHFSVMASVGFDADVIHRAHAERTGHITRAQYIRPILAAMMENDYAALRVFVDDRELPTVGRVVVVANLPVYALGLNIVPTARGDDGLLDVRVFQQGSVLHLMRYLYLMQFGQHEHATDVVKLRGARVRIEADSPVPVQTDGDPAGWTPVEIQVEPGHCEFFVPAAGQLAADVAHK